MTRTLAEEICTVTLYERLGGASGILQIVDGMVDAHLQNPVLKARFAPYLDDPERVAGIKHQICMQLAAESGGPDRYRGRGMAEAHRGMNINEAEYMAAIDDILGTMQRCGYDPAARNEVLAIVYPMKSEIIRA